MKDHMEGTGGFQVVKIPINMGKPLDALSATV